MYTQSKQQHPNDEQSTQLPVDIMLAKMIGQFFESFQIELLCPGGIVVVVVFQ
jgi:hypothetical protein